MQRFLLAYDGSESAQRAAAAASDLAKKYDATVAVISVMAWYGASEEARAEAEQRAQRLAEEGAQLLRKEGVNAMTLARLGDPASAILQAATDDGCSLIIMGHRGMTPSRIWVLGSVALKVINYASCPVLVVRGGGLASA